MRVSPRASCSGRVADRAAPVGEWVVRRARSSWCRDRRVRTTRRIDGARGRAGRRRARGRGHARGAGHARRVLVGRGEHAKREHQAGSRGGRDAGADHPAAHGRRGVPCVRCPRGVEQRVVERRGSLGRRLAARQPASQRIDVGRPGRGHRVPSASIAARSAWRAWWTRRQIIPRATPSARAASSAGDPLDHAHHVGHAQVVRQLVELARDLRQRALVGQRGIERPRRARGQVGEPLQRAGAPPGGTAMHVRQVAADREQPGPRRRRALEPRYGAERLEERALDQVIEVGILGGVGPGEEAVQRPVVAIEQHPEREDARVRLQREVRLCDLDVDVHPAALDQDVIREEMRLVAHRSNRLQIGDDQGLRWRGDIAGVGIVDHHAARRSVREPHGRRPACGARSRRPLHRRSWRRGSRSVR